MKRHLLAWMPALLVLGLSFWYWSHLRREHDVLMAQHSPHQHQMPPKANEPVANAPSPQKPSHASDSLADLRRQIRAEETALATTSLQAEQLATRMPLAATDELITSFGRIEDMGRDTATALQGLLRILAGTAKGGPEDEASVLKLLQVKGRLPEIRNFEDNPGEIARFQSSTLRHALGLSETTETAIQPLIHDAFTEMAAQNLTATKKPQPPAETADWVAKRSQALQELMLKLRPHLPDANAASTREALMFALNVGAGFDEEHSMSAGRATVTMGVKWPLVPW
jgi:hypothetical protein